MKNIKKSALLLTAFFGFSYGAFSQNFPGCPDVFVGADVDLEECTDIVLTADVFEVGSTESYEVLSIPYDPPISFTEPGGTAVSVAIDDVWSPQINLPFEFCYFGETYTSAKIGSNGAIGLGNISATSHPWSFSASVPSTSLVNAGQILGMYHDINPAYGGTVKWYLLGEFPCRTLVVVFNELPLYSCTSVKSSFMMVLYETTSVIDVYVKERSNCSWNGNNGVIGIQNHAGTVGYTPPGRNTGGWSVPLSSPEAWRFQPNGTAAPYTIEWLEGNTVIATGNSVSVAPGGPTVYTARATYTSCTGEVLIVEDELEVIPTYPNPMELSATHTNVSCHGLNDGTITINASNGEEPYMYYVDDGDPQPNNVITGLAPGIYLVGAIADDGCKKHTWVEIIDPGEIGLEGSATDVTCNGYDDGTITLTQSGGTPGYTYSLNGGSSQSEPLFEDLPAGTYEVIVTDGSGCQDTVVKVITEPDAPTTHITTTQTLYCAEGSTQIEVEGVTNGSFSATPQGLVISSLDGTINLESSQPGDYTVVYSYTENGCEYTDEIIITIAGFPEIGVPDNIYLCEGETWTPNATGLDNLIWSDGLVNGTPVHEPVGTHTYTVSGVSDDGCAVEKTVVVHVYPNPTVNVSADPTEGIPPLVVDFTNNSTGASDYTWTFGDGQTDYGFVDNHVYENPGIYHTVIVGTSDNGCVDSMAIEIVVIFPEMSYEFPNIFTPNGDGSNDFFIIKDTENIGSIEIVILNRWGGVVYEYSGDDVNMVNWNGKVKNTGMECSDGVYFYKAVIYNLYGEGTTEQGFVHVNRKK